MSEMAKELQAAFDTLRQKESQIAALRGIHEKLKKKVLGLNKQIELMKKEHAREISELKGVTVEVTSNEDYMDLVVDFFARCYDVRPEAICSRSRKRPLPQLRQMICHFLWYSNGTLTQMAIAKKMGYRDHSTVINGYQVVDDWFSVPKMYEKELKNYEKVRKHILYLRDSGELQAAPGRDAQQ